MKIATWNCGGGFRNKYSQLERLKADIYIIQECENPNLSTHLDYKNWAKNSLWIGKNKHKGLGIFASNSIQLKQLDWSNTYQDHQVNYFLPCSVNNKFNLLGVWAHRNDSPTFGYIGQVWKYLQINLDRIPNTIIAGDFNSNTKWDVWDRWWNHTNVIKLFELKGLKSVYHEFFNEQQGEELQPTFFHQKNPSKTYHIDYIFAPLEINSCLKSVQIGNVDEWISISDHMPFVCEFDT